MSVLDQSRRFCSESAAGPSFRQETFTPADPSVSLLNLSTVGMRMNSLQRFLWESINSKTVIGKDQMEMVNSEIESAIHEIIVNGTALVACSQIPLPADCTVRDFKVPVSCSNLEKLGHSVDLKIEGLDEELRNEIIDYELDCEIVELDAMELLAEHVHSCEICGKGFKRDANLRMHMRAHGNQFKTLEALAKPDKGVELGRKIRFSCPYAGCTRNKGHKKFRSLKSVICVKNHFKRSHFPKMYSCNRCHKKRFSVLADLKSHLKNCGETKWWCSCGTSFTRKDKLFGHMALFEGHMPAVEEEKAKGVLTMEENEDENWMSKEEMGSYGPNDMVFEGLLEGFGALESYCLEDVLGSS